MRSIALKRHGEAIAGYEKAIALRPDHPYAYSGLAEAALSICDWARTTELVPRLEALVAERKAIVNPFTLIRFSDKPDLHLQCARSFIADKVGALPPPLWTGERWSHERIRVAYLSADFHQHATAYLIAELIERHDRERFEITSISFGADDGGDIAPGDRGVRRVSARARPSATATSRSSYGARDRHRGRSQGLYPGGPPGILASGRRQSR